MCLLWSGRNFNYANYANYANYMSFVNYELFINYAHNSPSVRTSYTKCTIMYYEQTAEPRSAICCTHNYARWQDAFACQLSYYVLDIHFQVKHTLLSATSSWKSAYRCPPVSTMCRHGWWRTGCCLTLQQPKSSGGSTPHRQHLAPPPSSSHLTCSY